MGPFSIVGHDAAIKAKRIASTLVTRWRSMLSAAKQQDFDEVRIETTGGGQYFRGGASSSKEVWLKIGVRHQSKQAIGIVSREWGCSGVSFAQGLCGGGAAFSVTPVISAFMFLVPKAGIANKVIVDGVSADFEVPVDGGFVQSASVSGVPVPGCPPSGLTTRISLLDLCWARSGDKGNYANIGLIARRPEYLPHLRAQVTEARVAEHFAHNLHGSVTRYDLPGTSSMNFLLKDSLGGGGTSSLHSDPLAKTYGQVLLAMEIEAPVEWCNNPRLCVPKRTKITAKL